MEPSANPVTGTIRPYAETDWPALCKVHDAARPFELRPTVGMEAFLTLVESAEEEGLFDGALDVLDVGGQIVGFVAYKPDELTWLYVHPDHFGQGFGRRLLRHAISNADGVFSTEVLEGNTAAEALYLAEGFKLIQRSVGKLAGNESFPAVGLVLQYVANEQGPRT